MRSTRFAWRMVAYLMTTDKNSVTAVGKKIQGENISLCLSSSWMKENILKLRLVTKKTQISSICLQGWCQPQGDAWWGSNALQQGGGRFGEAETQTPAGKNSCCRHGNTKLPTQLSQGREWGWEGNLGFAVVFRQEYKLQRLEMSFFFFLNQITDCLFPLLPT